MALDPCNIEKKLFCCGCPIILQCLQWEEAYTWFVVGSLCFKRLFLYVKRFKSQHMKVVIAQLVFSVKLHYVAVIWGFVNVFERISPLFFHRRHQSDGFESLQPGVLLFQALLADTAAHVSAPHLCLSCLHLCSNQPKTWVSLTQSSPVRHQLTAQMTQLLVRVPIKPSW